jgi:antitoxin (DNA-binding transcriptional repressor) of toxin-antitoxin stability system
MLQITVKEAKAKLDDLIQAAENGEEILIIKDEKTFKIVEVEKPKKKYREFGTAKGQFKIADDFDTPLEDFKNYEP